MLSAWNKFAAFHRRCTTWYTCSVSVVRTPTNSGGWGTAIMHPLYLTASCVPPRRYPSSSIHSAIRPSQRTDTRRRRREELQDVNWLCSAIQGSTIRLFPPLLRPWSLFAHSPWRVYIGDDTNAKIFSFLDETPWVGLHLLNGPDK